MVWLWLILGFIILLVALLWFSQISMRLYGSRMEENDHIFVEIKALLGLLRYRYDIPLIQFRNLWNGLVLKTEEKPAGATDEPNKERERITYDQVKQFYEKAKQFLSNVYGFNDWMKDSLARVKCTEFRWDTQIGVGDAVGTAMTTGVIWGIKSSLSGYIFRFIDLVTKPRLTVQPVYNFTKFSTEFSCIGKIRLGDAILAGLLLLIRLMKVKGGIRTWQNILFKA